jgi:predicted ester cyclase
VPDCRSFVFVYLSHPIKISHRISSQQKLQNRMKRFLISTAVLACMATACNNNTSSSAAATTDTSSAMMSSSKTDMTQKNKQTAIAADQAVNNHDADGLFKDASPDFIDYGDGSMPPVKGLDSNKKYFQMFLVAFPDIKGENLMTVAEGNQVIIYGDWSGTFKGPLMGMKPTGKSYKVKDVDFFTFNDDGKITEHRSAQSMETILSQVGAKMKK